MRVVSRRSGFIVALATMTAIFLGGMVYSGGVTLGQETDVAPVAPTAVAPQQPQQPSPPQAPIDPNADAVHAGAVNALPNAGNGGYLGQSSSSAYAVLASLGLAVLAGGSLVLAYKRR